MTTLNNTLRDNIIKIKYFETPPSKEGWTLLNEKVAENIYYKIDYFRNPYLTNANKFMTLDVEREENIYPHRFLVMNDKDKLNEYSFFYKNFLFGRHSKLYENGVPVFEIRLKNSDDQWSDWQALVSSRNKVDWDFSIFVGLPHNQKVYFQYPLTDDTSKSLNTIKSLNDIFEIRYGGRYYVTRLCQSYILSDDYNSYKIDPKTRNIEFVYNPCGSEKDRLNYLKEYENRYFKYDENDNRI